MRFAAVSLLTLVATGTGCARYTGYSDRPASAYSAYPGGQNPGQWTPLPQPGSGPAGPQQPYGYGYGAPQPYGQTQPYGQPQPQPYASNPGPGYYEQILRPVNVPALLAMQGRVPCAPREVAPATWATFDCAPFEALTRAIQYVPVVRFNFLPTGPLPASVDHRTEGNEGPIRDQGAVGACTAMSLAAAMDNGVRRMGRSDTVSALHLWSRYGVGVTGKAGDSNVGKSVAIETTWRYDPARACKLSHSAVDTCTTAYGVSSGSEAYDPELKAEHARADASARYKLGAVEALHAKPADPNEIAGVLAGGDDVWISFSVNDQAWTNKALHDGIIQDYESVDDTGHAVVLAGYRTLPNGTKQFLIHNSWSTRWGVNGYGWISEAMVSRYTRSAYRVRVGEGSGGGSTPVADGGDCPAGQTKAPILGTCIPTGGGGGGGGAPGFPGFSGVPGMPGFPGMPGLPGAAPPPPAPSAPAAPKAPAAPSSPSACPGGAPSIAGVCLPIPR